MEQMAMMSSPAPFMPVLMVKQVSWFDDRFYRLLLFDNTVIFLPSVTTVLHAVPKPFLATWRGNVGNREADRIMYESADKGSRIHHACYTYATKGGVIWDPPSYKGMTDLNVSAAELRKQLNAAGRPHVTLTDQDEMMQVGRFVKWLDVVNPQTQGMEMVVYSLELGVAGTLDYVHRIEAGKYAIASKPIQLDKTGLYVQDLKTGNEDQSYWMQIAAYARMYEISTGQRIEGGMITYLDSGTQTGIQGCKTVYKNWEELKIELDDFMNTKRLWVKFFGNTTPKVFDFPNLWYNNKAGAEDIPHDFVVPNVNEKVKDALPNVSSKSVEVAAPVSAPATAEKKDGVVAAAVPVSSEDSKGPQGERGTQVPAQEAAGPQGTADLAAMSTKRQPRKRGADLTSLT